MVGPCQSVSQSGSHQRPVPFFSRLGLLQEHLADIFKVSPSTVGRILTTMTQFLYEHLSSLAPWPTAEEVLINQPPHFIAHPNTFVVFDCTGTELIRTEPDTYVICFLELTNKNLCDHQVTPVNSPNTHPNIWLGFGMTVG